MAIDQQRVQQYLQGVLKSLESDPKVLSKEELRVATKYRNEVQKLERVNQDISQMRDQIRQAEARLRSLELQAADSQGRANGLLDYLASSKFEEDPMPSPENPGGFSAAEPSAPAPVTPSPVKRRGPVPGVRPPAGTQSENAKASEA